MFILIYHTHIPQHDTFSLSIITLMGLKPEYISLIH